MRGRGRSRLLVLTGEAIFGEGMEGTRGERGINFHIGKICRLSGTKEHTSLR